jgi:chitin disaccharide deacetylase
MPTAATRTLILCADDFGLDPAIDRAILALVADRRLSAVSCMTGGTSWRQSAPLLAQAQGTLSVGLHLTLTEISPLGTMPRLAATGTLPRLNNLLRQTLQGHLDAREIRAEARRQLDAFCQHFGRPPAHIDGHQHIHCFPVIRAVVYELAEEYGCAVRLCATPLQAIVTGHAPWAKAVVINMMGMGFHDVLNARAIPHNREFYGLHAFNPAHDIRTMYAGWFTAAKDGALINCHPAATAIPNDPLAAWRTHEYDFLRSPDFTTLCANTACRLGTFAPRPIVPA